MARIFSTASSVKTSACNRNTSTTRKRVAFPTYSLAHSLALRACICGPVGRKKPSPTVRLTRVLLISHNSQLTTRDSQLLAVREVEVPPAIVPFQCYFPPAQWDLWIRVKRTDVGPRRSRILFGVGQSSIVWRRSITWPGVAR